jgi:hypothetical protein
MRIRLLDNEELLPIRGIFVIANDSMRYDDIFWPLGIHPFIFISCKSVQSQEHYHYAFVLPYIANSIRDIEHACGFLVYSFSRIKSSWPRVENYIKRQSTCIIDFIFHKAEARLYKNLFRAKTTKTAITSEYESLGFPAYFDASTLRKA